jgi:hypothetical protein
MVGDVRPDAPETPDPEMVWIYDVTGLGLKGEGAEHLQAALGRGCALFVVATVRRRAAAEFEGEDLPAFWVELDLAAGWVEPEDHAGEPIPRGGSHGG